MMTGFLASAMNLKPKEAMYGVKDRGEMIPGGRVRELAGILANASDGKLSMLMGIEVKKKYYNLTD